MRAGSPRVPLVVVLLVALVATVGSGAARLRADQARDGTFAARTGTAALGGIVKADHADGVPVRRAVVRLSGTGLPPGTMTVTDDEGRFLVDNLPAGRFTVSVSKSAWVPAYYGANRPGAAPGTPIALLDGERKVDIVVPLARGAVLAGRIVDQNGTPLSGLRPALMLYRTQSGKRVLSRVGAAGAAASGTTDDRGEFRLYGLAPGTYVIGVTPTTTSGAGARLTTSEEVQWAMQRAASGPTDRPVPPPAPGPAVAYAVVYYPGTIDANAATAITLSPGEERAGIEIAMQFVPTSRVTGTILRQDGTPAARASISVMPANAASSPLQNTTTRVSVVGEGRFELPALAPGDYLLMARAADVSVGESVPQPPPGQAPPLDLWASATLSTNGSDIDGVAMTLRPGLTLSGVLQVAEPLVSGQPVPQFSVRLATAPGAPTAVRTTLTGRVGADGRFTVPGITPGEYLLTVSPGPGRGAAGGGWMPKSVVVNNEDVLDSGVVIRPDREASEAVITMTDRISGISGTLTDGAGRPAPEYFVFVFPADRGSWRTGSMRFRPPVRPDEFGVYRVPGLPPGEYLIAALTDIADTEWADPDLLEQVAGAAIRVTLAEGEAKVQDIRLAGGG
jgi:hypothetical protein